jgi:beta-lactam-binding protein with PASTA domain
MSSGLETRLLDLLANPAAAAEQADLAQAAALRRQEIALRQRAGAAAARLRRAKEAGAPPEKTAALEALMKSRLARLDRTTRQAEAADIMRPKPDPQKAQVFGRTTGTVEKPPVTAAALSPEGKVLAASAAMANGSFHLATEGAFDRVTLQFSDAEGRALYRAAEPVTVEAGSVLLVEVALGAPKPEPGPVPTRLTMPDLVGQSEGVALALLDRLGLKAEIEDRTEAGEPGIVLAQKPQAGTEIADGATVALTVRRAAGPSPGPQFLPGLVGKTRAEAETRLKELGLDAVVELRVDPGPAGIVLAQDPKEGTALAGLASVRLTVSEARSADALPVPDLRGRTEAAATDLLKALGFEVKVSTTQDPAAAEGVIAQDPAPGTLVKKGSTVAITVNAPPKQESGVVITPRLVGLDVAEARQLLKELGLDASEESVTDPAPRGRVLNQSPDAGTRLEPGKTVKLAVSTGRGRGRSGLDNLRSAMARDVRAEETGIDARRLAKLFDAAGVTTLEGARALAELEPAALRDRLTLGSIAAARRFRAILRKALAGLG